MDLDQIRNYCLEKSNVEECTPFGPEALVYKVEGKIFLILSLETEAQIQFNAKCDPEYACTLREQFDFVLPGYPMNKKHWNTVKWNLQHAKLCFSLIDHSYELVSKKPSKNRK